MIKKYNLIIITLMLVGFSVSSQEEENKFFITGYIKNLNELSFVDKMEQLQWTNLFHNRFNFKYIPTDEFILRLELRNRLYYGDRVKIIPLFSNLISDNEGLIDLSWNVVDANNVVLNATIDRVLINYNKGKWDITLGRQRINWGMNLVWNPNDIFNSYNFLDFD